MLFRSIAEGDTKDVGREVLEGGAAVADGLAMHDPILLPHGSGDVRKALGLTQGVAELGAKESGQRLDGEQEILAGRQPSLSVLCQSSGGDQVMHAGMVGQIPRPGVQDTDEAKCAADKTRVTRQLLSGFRRGAVLRAEMFGGVRPE